MNKFLFAGVLAAMVNGNFDSDTYVEGASTTDLASVSSASSSVMTSSDAGADSTDNFSKGTADAQTGVSTQLAATEQLVSQMKEANQSTANAQQSNSRLIAAKNMFKQAMKKHSITEACLHMQATQIETVHKEMHEWAVKIADMKKKIAAARSRANEVELLAKALQRDNIKVKTKVLPKQKAVLKVVKKQKKHVVKKVIKAKKAHIAHIKRIIKRKEAKKKNVKKGTPCWKDMALDATKTKKK